MPSSPGYKRDYKQERRTAKKRGETGVGSKSGDATRHRDRREHEKKNGKISKDKELHHPAGKAKGKTKVISKKANRSDGGKKGNRTGKAAGGRKGKR
jgi:hypothetical protein